MKRKTGRRALRGFSIVELMVSTTISLIMFGVIIELFASNKEAYRLQEGASVLNENARFAVAHLQFYMRLADHWGGIEPVNVSVDAGVPAPSFIDVTVTECDGDNVISNVGFRGFDSVNTDLPLPLNCMGNNYEPNTDAFFIRYGVSHEHGRVITDESDPVANGVPVMPNSTDGETPVLSSYVSGAEGDGIWLRTVLGRRSVIFENSDLADLPSDVYSAGDPDPVAVTNYRYQAMLYYIRSCEYPETTGTATLCDSTDDSIPTLVRLTLNPDLSFDEEVIVSGVENMQLLYGVDDSGDFVADRYDVAEDIDDASNWSNVVSVRVSLIVANLERDNTVNDTKTYYVLDSTWQPPAEGRNFRRSQYDFTVQIRNMTRA